ncbi:MAG TPA: 1-acyl-sn-glycerol-3-phosphate acyltransferase [Bacteroidia bacterium]|nr:1-acyl-sn-glycerol-3-phosphate acyltransferase [Bacteroidia bacterium]
MNLLLHYILKAIYYVTAQLYYAKISVLNLEKVPVNKPLLIAINHSNAFWDGVMIGLHTKQAVWFLARGDVFKKPIAAKILNAIGIAPIYRMQEGFENIEKNKEVFNRCYQLLNNNASIAIFPEGNCERESKLRPLKKGTARIAHGALQSFTSSKELFVTCVGLNYDDPDSLNSEVLINFNQPLKVNDYFDASKILDSQAAMRFTKDVENALNEAMYNIHDHNNHVFFHFVKRNFLYLLIAKSKSALVEFEKLKAFSHKINTQNDLLNSCKPAVIEYIEELSKHKLREKYIKQNLVQHKFISNYITFLFLLIPSIPALLFNSWPYMVANKIATKTVKKREFYSSVNIGAAGALHFVWYLILLLIFTLTISLLKAFMLVLALHFSGVLALHLATYFRAIKAHIKIAKLTKSEKEIILQKRMACVQAIQKFTEQ